MTKNDYLPYGRHPLFLLQKNNVIMKTTAKLLSIALLVFLNICVASAQKVNDYYKFADDGNLCEFQLTLQDSTVIKYKHNHDSYGDWHNLFVKGDYAIVQYPDGTVIDFTNSYYGYAHGESPALLTVIQNPTNSGWYYPVNEWYKALRKTTAAPKGKDMIVNTFNLYEYSIIFPDNSQVEVQCGRTPDENKIKSYIDINDNGDYLNGYDRYTIESISLHSPELEVVDMDTSTSERKECVLSLVSDGYSKSVNDTLRHQTTKGYVYFNNGESFKGKVYLYFLQGDAYKHCAPKSKYLKEIFDEAKFKYLGFDNIVAVSFIEGNVLDKDNKLVAMYKDNKKLDEFDMASVAAAEQGKIDKAQAAAKAAAKAKDALTTKYGKKYADAFLAGKVIVGMPWELVQLGIDAHSFKDFYTALISIDRSSGSGKTECYSLYGDDFTHRGHIWVSNKVVESITLY